MNLNRKNRDLKGRVFTIVLLSIIFGVLFIIENNLSGIEKSFLRLKSNLASISIALKKTVGLSGARARLNVEKVKLDIKHKHHQRLAFKREQTLALKHREKPVLEKTSDDWVPAKIRFSEKEDKTVKVKVRLKGRLKDHWGAQDMWSLNLKTRGEKTLFGMKYMSLQHPKTRGYLNEWFIHKLFKCAGLIALRYDFVYVSLNGDDHKLYALEEGLGKRLIENNALREGPIFKLNTDYSWKWGASGLNNIGFFNTDIAAFQSKRVSQDPVKSAQLKRAKELLNSFRSNSLPASQVFDSEKLARLFALLELTGHAHASAYDNLRFYFNPVTGLIEAIGRDNQYIKDLTLKEIKGARRALLDQSAKEDWYQMLFADPVFYQDYIRSLEEFSKESFVTSCVQPIREEFHAYSDLLEDNYPGKSQSSQKILSIIKSNAQKIHKMFTEPRQLLMAYFQGYDPQVKKIDLFVHNSYLFPVRILSFETEKGDVSLVGKKIILPAHSRTQVPYYKKVSISVRSLGEIKTIGDFKKEELKLRFRFIGAQNTQVNTVFMEGNPEKISRKRSLVKESANHLDFSFLKTDFKNKIIHFKKGSWLVDRDLVFPEGFEIVARAPLEINLIKKR